MTDRFYSDWLTAYCDWASYTEAPRKMHFWTGVSTIAGALERKVWIDQVFFKWYPNFYVIMVAKPGIVAKSTTADVGMDLLKETGSKFGPHIVTWQALVDSFQQSAKMIEINGEYQVMSALTCVASELGNLLNPKEKELVDLLITLYDGRKELDKQTKTSGKNLVQNMWVNIIGCTTPGWIAENVPQIMLSGGLTSRCLFVYADKKSKYVAFPADEVPIDHLEKRIKLVADLNCISTEISGPYQIAADARVWYKKHYPEMLEAGELAGLNDESHGGYLARKQTHTFKLAIVLSASRSNDRIITLGDVATAEKMIEDLEPDIPKVFSKIGKSTASLQTDRLLEYMRRRQIIPYEDAYRYMHSYFPDLQNLEGIVAGVIKAGFVQIVAGSDGKHHLKWLG